MGLESRAIEYRQWDVKRSGRGDHPPVVIEKLASNNAGITRAAPVIVWDQVWD
jgi:hypothetical protein